MTFLKLLLPIIAFLGILDSTYLTYEKFSGKIPVCNPPFDCGTVLSSPFASIGPIPVSLLGILFYTTALILGSLYFVDIREFRLLGKRIATFQLFRFVAVVGFLFSLYFVSLMAFVLNAWCLYCIGSALTSTLLFIGTSLVSSLRKRSDEANQEFPLRLAFFSLAYEHILKRIFFLFDPEFVHNIMVRTGEFLGTNGLTQVLARSAFAYEHEALVRKLAGISFPNPVGLSAGFDYDGNLTQILPDVGFGFMTIGTVTRFPYEGNVRPMLTRFPDSHALLVNKGFKSMGAEAIIEKLAGKDFRIPVGISIGSTNRVYESTNDQVDDIVQTFQLFENSTVAHAYYELNISCPNTKGGQPFTDPKRFAKLVTAVGKLNIRKPIFLKMPIDLEDGLSEKETHSRLFTILELASKSTFITGVICGNLTKDHENPLVVAGDQAKWKSMKGGVSGKPTFERSNALIRLVKRKFGKRFIIIGTGGVFSGTDAQAKIEAGADLVQLITGMIYKGPQVIGEINHALSSHQ